jgi:hypothetical protein
MSGLLAQKVGQFGISLMPTFKGVVTFGIVYTVNGEIVASESLGREDWMRQASGEQLSKANPKRENFFILNKVDSCWVLFDSIYATYGKMKYVGHECIPIDLLWKLRYKDHPYVQDNTGWAKTPLSPSLEQMSFLQEAYGLMHLDGFIYGDNLWRLLREIQLPNWQRFYSAGGTMEQYKEFIEGAEEDEDPDVEEDDDDENDDENGKESSSGGSENSSGQKKQDTKKPGTGS